MSEERFPDLAVIAMHYPERFEVDEICEAFVKAHPRRLFQAMYVVWLTRYVEKWQITIVNSAVPFNLALLVLGLWLRNKINSRFYFMPSQRQSQECCKWRFRGKNWNVFFGGRGGMALDPLKRSRQRNGAVTRLPGYINSVEPPFKKFLDPPLVLVSAHSRMWGI